MIERMTVGSILTGAFVLVMDDALAAGLAVTLLTGLQTVLDQYQITSFLPVTAAILLANYVLTRHVVRRNGLAVDGHTGDFPNTIGAAFLIGIGVLLGLLALIVPGLYLAARWSLTTVIIVAERKSATEAIDASWRLTKPWVGTLFGVFVVIWSPSLLGILIAVATDDLLGPIAVVRDIVLNLTTDAPTVFGWYACLALYAALKAAPKEKLSEVFA